MNSVKFVEVIHKEVRNAAIDGVMELLEQPPGRRPEAELVNLSNWFKSLAPDDKQRVKEVVVMASNQAVFGFFCVLDGVRVIENLEDRGVLELRYVKNKKTILLNDPDLMPLHDL
jgi:hypothetical protein